MSAYKHILYEVRKNLAVITINEPKVRNALRVLTIQELLDALNRSEDDAAIGAVMITGAEGAFCAGFNLREIPLGGGTEAVHAHFRVAALWWHQLLHKIVRIRLPVLAAVNGVAAGGGFGMALACDLAVCSDKARFLCAWHGIGIGNDTATSYSLPRIVGVRRAMELMLTNRTLSAQEAAEWGVVNRVYPHTAFAEKARSIAQGLADGPTHLQVMAKRSFHAGWLAPIEECTETEIQNVLDSVKHPHFRPCLESFMKGGKADRPQVELPG